MARRWRRRPAGSNWGEFGDDDQIGRLNLITAERVRGAIAEASEGLTFCLSLPLDYPGTTRGRQPPILRPVMRAGEPYFARPWNNELMPGVTDVVSDDFAILYMQYSTHWDSLCHVGHLFDADDDGIDEPVYYNGYRADEHIATTATDIPGELTSAVSALDIAGTAVQGVQGRGVMIDLEAHYGRSATIVDYDKLQRVLDADQIEVREGDLVCLHTGYGQALLDMQRQPDLAALAEINAGLDGRDQRLLGWITNTGLSALISDNPGVEIYPYPDYSQPTPRAALPLHEHCIFKLGVHIGEYWYLTELALWLREHQRTAFLLTAPPLRLPGAVGSPVTPIATV